jgi:hypothetical protein
LGRHSAHFYKLRNNDNAKPQLDPGSGQEPEHYSGGCTNRQGNRGHPFPSGHGAPQLDRQDSPGFAISDPQKIQPYSALDLAAVECKKLISPMWVKIQRAHTKKATVGGLGYSFEWSR